ELGFPPSRMQEAEELKEQSCGQWEGKNRADVFPTDASLPRITSAQPDFFCPGGESQRQVEFRMVEFFNQLAVSRSAAILAKCRSMPPNAPPIPPYRIGIFSHSTAIKCLLRGLIGSSPHFTHRFDIAVSSLTLLTYSPGANSRMPRGASSSGSGGGRRGDGGSGGWRVGRVNDTTHLLLARGPLPQAHISALRARFPGDEGAQTTVAVADEE
ncbi:unnamed protein product, partial [Closterium sp. NIES-53]